VHRSLLPARRCSQSRRWPGASRPLPAPTWPTRSRAWP